MLAVVEERYWTPEEIAERLNLSKSSIYGLLRSGELESIKIGAQYRVPESVLDAFLEARKVRKKGASPPVPPPEAP